MKNEFKRILTYAFMTLTPLSTSVGLSHNQNMTLRKSSRNISTVVLSP